MNEDRVQARLRELRESMADVSAPESVESAVMAAFRERKASRRRLPRIAPVWRWAAAACVALMALFAGWRMMQPEPKPEIAREVPKPAAPAPVVTEPAPMTAAVAVPARPKRVKPTVRPAVRPVPPQPQQEDAAAAFVALPYAPPLAPAEDQHVVRVRLPRAAMRQFGMFVREDRMREPVQADFLLGQDGVARAVRLVSNTR
jgi:hypothetical protein